MVKIIAVHGTNDAEPNPERPKWWEPGSDFHRTLAETIAEPIDYAPFRWSGANSEMERCRQGSRLAKLIRKESEPPIVIGHSHGGSIAAHAFFDLYHREGVKAAARVRTVVAVGTPMIRYEAQPTLLMSRFNLVGQLFWLYAVVIGALLFWEVFGGGAPFYFFRFVGFELFEPFEGDLARLNSLFSPAVLTAILIPFIIFLVAARRSNHRNRLLKRNELKTILGSKLIDACHSGDEAVAALRAALAMNTRIITAWTGTRSVLAPIAILLAIAYWCSAIGHSSSSLERNLERNSPAFVLFDLVPVDEAEGSRVFRLEGGDFRFRSNWTLVIPRNWSRRTGFLKNNYWRIDLWQAATLSTKADVIAYLDKVDETRRTDVDLLVAPVNGMELRGRFYFLAETAFDALRDEIEALPDATVQATHYDCVGNQVESDFDYVSVGGALAGLPAQSASACREGEPARSILTRDRIEDLTLRFPQYVLTSRVFGGFTPCATHRSVVTEQKRLIYDRTECNEGTIEAHEYSKPLVAVEPLYIGETIEFDRLWFDTMRVGCLKDELVNLLASLRARAPEISPRLGFCMQFEAAPLSISDLAAVATHASVNFLTKVMQDVTLPFRIALSEIGSEAAKKLSFSVEEALRPIAFVASTLTLASALALIIGPLLAGFLSIVFDNSARAQILGNDGYGERAAAVGAGIDIAAKGGLPAEIEEAITNHTSQFHVETARRLREVFSLAGERGATALVSDMLDNLTFDELIHTAYFAVPEFRSYLVQSLIERTGLDRRPSDAS